MKDFQLVKDIAPGLRDANLSQFKQLNGKLYFIANSSELWESDGSNAGTKLVSAFDNTIDELEVANNKLYLKTDSFSFSGTNQLWENDGTTAGTKSINFNGSYPSNLTEFNGKLYFTGGSQFGTQLWTLDGATSTPTVVTGSSVSGSSANLNSLGNAYNLTAFNGKLYFTSDSGTTGEELWVSDGTDVGTKLFKDINPAAGEGSDIYNLTVANGKLYFTANNGTTGEELWVSDGTTTQMVKEINSGSAGSSLDNLTAFNGKLYFSAYDGTNGLELWESDGTEAGTKRTKDINPGVGSASPEHLTVFNGKLYFTANNGTSGNELWVSDGTEAGTKLVKDFVPGSDGLKVSNLEAFQDKLYLSLDDGINGYELSALDINNLSTAETALPLTIDFSTGKTGKTISAFEEETKLKGTINNDTISGNAKNNQIKAGGGNDQVYGDAGNDLINGDSGDDLIQGGKGNDKLSGGLGNDILVGEVGKDTLTGGAGRDTFTFYSLDKQADTISDFKLGEDLIDLQYILSATNFRGTTPLDQFEKYVTLTQVGSDTVVQIDADGRGAGTNLTSVALLQNVAVSSLDASSFVV